MNFFCGNGFDRYGNGCVRAPRLLRGPKRFSGLYLTRGIEGPQKNSELFLATRSHFVEQYDRRLIALGLPSSGIAWVKVPATQQGPENAGLVGLVHYRRTLVSELLLVGRTQQSTLLVLWTDQGGGTRRGDGCILE